MTSKIAHMQHQYWLGFSLVKGIGPGRLRALWIYFNHDLERAWNASSDDLLQAGVGERALENFLALRKKANLPRYLNRLHEIGSHLCTLDDDCFPNLLREIHDAPPLLYVKGRLLPADDQALAIVGTRKASGYGIEVAKRMAGAVAQAGVTVVSGLARGLDAVAHEAALDVGGRTIAVLGSGIDTIYPSENLHLVERIITNDQGAIVTEHPPKTPPDSRHFPSRNRIISGLSLGVLIVEAPHNSGALLTASSAAEQGREVFAIPGHITAPNSTGTNALIQDGAKLVMTPEDILEELSFTYRAVQTQQVAATIAPEDELEAQIIDILTLEPLHIDDITIQCKRDVAEVSAKLMMMTIKGLIQEVAPLTYGRFE